MNIYIAGVNFSIRCQDSVKLQDHNPVYSSFLVTKNTSTNINIDVRIQINNFPDMSKRAKIFDSGHAWSMFMDDENYVVVMNPQDSDKQPVWTARFDHAVQKVTICIGKRLIDKHNDVVMVPNLVTYPLDQILLMYLLAQREGALIHSAGLCFRDRGYIFPGKSGAGKSTLTRQFTNYPDYEILSDDRMVVRKIDGQMKAFGTPWAGEAGIAVNKHVPLAGIFFMSRGSSCSIKEILPKKAMERLLPVVSIPWYDKDKITSILSFCEDLISNVPAYEIHFKPDIKVADVFEKFVSGK